MPWISVLVYLIAAGFVVCVLATIFLIVNTRRTLASEKLCYPLLNSLPKKFLETQKALEHTNVTAETKKEFEGLSKRFKACSIAASTDWTELLSKLKRIDSGLSYVDGAIQSDKIAARYAAQQALEVAPAA